MNIAAIVVGGVAVLLLGVSLAQRVRSKSRHRELLEGGVPDPVRAYGVDVRAKTTELGPVGEREALDLLRDRNQYADTFFESGEEAMMRTRVGFLRGDSEFVEFDALSDCIHIRIGGDLAASAHEEEVDLAIADAETLLKAYMLSSAALIEHWRQLPNTRKSS